MPLSLRHRHHNAQLQVIASRPVAPVESPSFLLEARPQDEGAMWPALAWRCRQALPERLRWAEPLLDPQHPRSVLCGEPRVVELYHWLDALPNTERVSIACQRKAPNTDARAH